MSKRAFICDKEIAGLLSVSEKTIYRMLAGFTPKRVHGKSINLWDAKPINVNGRRRWRPEMVASVLGLSVEEVMERIR